MDDGDGLENRCPSMRDRGFESHLLRHFEANLALYQIILSDCGFCFLLYFYYK